MGSLQIKTGLVQVLREEAGLLRSWAEESVTGGWSTHQVKPMRERAAKLDAMADQMSAMQILTFSAFAAINSVRTRRWHPNGPEEWNVAEWTNAMAGEAGEACNAAKKLRRIECRMQQADGDTPTPKDIVAAGAKIAKEIGDTVCYADLVCQRIGWTLEDAVRLAFNQISEREGFPERL